MLSDTLVDTLGDTLDDRRGDTIEKNSSGFTEMGEMVLVLFPLLLVVIIIHMAYCLIRFYFQCKYCIFCPKKVILPNHSDR